METLEGRLASFKLQSTRRKVNEPYASTSAWPHHPTRFSVTPATLAAAGFYHDPTESAPDNVTCVYCSKGLEGWENGDDALDEHLKRIVDKDTQAKCPWATIMGVKRDFDLFGPEELDGGKHDPSAEYLVAARKKTFGNWWKFDGKKGWKPTSDRLARAGFYSNPLTDAPDTCACAYCDVQLDGWSKSDDPEKEHRSRQPDCFFFKARASHVTSNAKQSTRAVSAATRKRHKQHEEDDPSIKADSDAPSNLTASTSGKKKTTKKRSATIASTAAHPKLTEATDTSEQTVLEADTGLAPKQAKSTKRSPKSRQSRLTTASSKKIDTTLSDAETVEQGPEVNGPSEVNADDSAEPVIPTKSKRRTTRNAGIVSKTTARAKGTKTLSAAKSKKSQPSEQEYAQPSDMEMQTEAAVDLSEAESVGMSRRDAKLVTSSKIESQPGNKKIRTRSTRVRSSQMDQMPPQTGKLAQAQQDPARSESYNEVLTSRAELHPADPADTPKDAMPPALNDCTSSQPSTSTPDAVADTESIPRSDLKANINKQASGPGETRTLRKPPARSKPSSSQPSEQITSESEIEDEPDVRKSDITSVIIPMATSDEGSQEAATPKAASNSSKTHERGDLIESSADSLTRLRGSSNTNIELSVNVPEQPDTMRPVKALPAHKSEHQSRNRKDPSFVTAFNQQLKVLPPLAQHEWIDHQAATSQSSRGQMALDALLAKSPPTFDSPEKQFTSTQTRLLPSPQAGDSPDPSALLVPTKGLQVHTTLKEWLEMLRTQELERFTTDSRQLLRMFDEHTQRNRDQLVSFLAQTQI